MHSTVGYVMCASYESNMCRCAVFCVCLLAVACVFFHVHFHHVRWLGRFEFIKLFDANSMHHKHSDTHVEWAKGNERREVDKNRKYTHEWSRRRRRRRSRRRSSNNNNNGLSKSSSAHVAMCLCFVWYQIPTKNIRIGSCTQYDLCTVHGPLQEYSLRSCLSAAGKSKQNRNHTRKWWKRQNNKINK